MKNRNLPLTATALALALLLAPALSTQAAWSKAPSKQAQKAAHEQDQAIKDLRKFADELAQSIALLDQMNQYVVQGSNEQAKTVVTCTIFLADHSATKRAPLKVSNAKHPAKLRGGFDPKTQALDMKALALSQVLPLLVQAQAASLLAGVGQPEGAVVTVQLEVERQSHGKKQTYFAVGQAEMSGKANVKSIGILADKDLVFGDEAEMEPQLAPAAPAPTAKPDAAAPSGSEAPAAPTFDTGGKATTQI